MRRFFSGILSEVPSSAEGFFDPRARWTRRGSKILKSRFLFFPEITINFSLNSDLIGRFFRFLEAFDMTAEMQFLPDLLQSEQRLTHVLDLDND